MEFLNVGQAQGHKIALQRTDPRHIAGRLGGAQPGASESGPEGGFGAALARALNGVNDLQLDAMQKSQAMITDPDSVDVHDVTVALAEANLALSITKAIADRALRAYQEIINVR